MPSPPPFRPGRLSISPSRNSSSPSSPTSRSPQRNQHNQQRPPAFKLHPYLQTTQRPTVEKIHSSIIWDLRENPLTSAQDAFKLDTPTARLSPELLNAYATDPPVAFLNVTCGYPEHWTLVVYASALTQAVGGAGGTGAGMRNTVPVYPPADVHRREHGHARSSSASPQGGTAQLTIAGPPHRPTMSTVPLPVVTPSSTPGLSPVSFNSPLASPTTATTAVAGTSSSREVGITIADLLQAIYDHLHTESVSLVELSTRQPRQRALIEDAYDKRRRMSASSPTRPQFHGNESLLGLGSPMSPTFAVNFTSPESAVSTSSAGDGGEGEGMKRVDMLLMHTLFAGMDVDPEKDMTVILSLRRPA
ncbi:hypothetical protein P691DRAFT_184616 [Macrolepiota fuliginosa MF-IS2]|uniref:DUF6699 domain-containing protein n=1 Tax=Macrolepiota fuliginosa MF-IS2 TaxID=1400762 RepID=A0A9P5XAN1_9AGAR|nr:hypothetical protein P691DRAFT_184616 [Macrolepiota fuliginosa MF-IS2]